MKTEYEILNYDLGGVLLKDATTPTFIGWISKKLNGVAQPNFLVNELTSLISRPPMGRLSDLSKIDIFRKVEKLGVQL